MQIFCPVLMITYSNLFHGIFLQYTGSWAWRNFYQVKISRGIMPLAQLAYTQWVYYFSCLNTGRVRSHY